MFSRSIVLILLFLAGCTSLPRNNKAWLDSIEPTRTGSISSPAAARASQVGVANAGQDSGGFESAGSGRFTRAIATVGEGRTVSGEEGVTLNLVNAPIPAAAKTVLGDLLGMNFVVDDRVQGTVTVQTAGPVTKAAMVDVFETVLRSRGAAIVEDAGFSRIVPLEDARVRMPGLADEIMTQPRPGLSVQVVPLNYVSAEEMRGLLEPVTSEGGILRVDAARNLIMITGTSSELQAIRETIALFDVDWMKGMSFALYPLKASDPDTMSTELETVFQKQGGRTGDLVRFVPNQRLNAVLVIAARPHYLEEAGAWIKRLDQAAQTLGRRLVVYPLHNRPASEVAPLLQAVLSGGGPSPGASSGTSEVAPALKPIEISTDGGLAGGATSKVTQTSARPASDGSVTVVPDDANNALMVYASGSEHDRIVSILVQIDRMPTQVLLEATIAEVALNDELKFGLRWFFEKGGFRGKFTDSPAGSMASVFPGFSFLFSSSSLQVVVDALASVTDVKIVSSPTLMVLDNEEASLQVGDQVPVVTQTAQSVTDPNAPIVNQIEMKDTGVILLVRPHVNESGRVVLDIRQEVSSVVPTTTSGIDSPTIRQRRLATTVVVADNESLALGGLIQDRNSQKRSKVPLLGDIPVLGNAFRQKQDVVERSELIVFIHPRIVRDVAEAREITEEYRNQLHLQAPEYRRARETIERDAGRAFR